MNVQIVIENNVPIIYGYCTFIISKSNKTASDKEIFRK